jgi:hypothetical protein
MQIPYKALFSRGYTPLSERRGVKEARGAQGIAGARSGRVAAEPPKSPVFAAKPQKCAIKNKRTIPL